MAHVFQTSDRQGRPHPRWKFRYVDWQGKRHCGTGTTKKAETQRMADAIEEEHHKRRLGYLPPPKTSERHAKRPFVEVAEEYLAWGRSQGGRYGRPWSPVHITKRTAQLLWWQKELGLEVLSDLADCLPRVEAVLRDFQTDHSGRTVSHYSGTLKAFCRWCVDRGYLEDDPLKRLGVFDVTPKTTRRALTQEEVKALLEACARERRLLYEVALCSGLRAHELASLRKKHLSVERSGLWLEANWTKNRKPGFQPLPSALVARLTVTAEDAGEDTPLVRVPSHPARELDKDLEAAGIPKWSPEGKVDFHSLRVAYTTFIWETGATTKEAQSLARHSDPRLTANTYGRTRLGSLHARAESLGKMVLLPDESQIGAKRKAAGAEGYTPTPEPLMDYEMRHGARRGIRTPTPEGTGS